MHRIGQQRECTIWKLLATDSLDEKAVLLRAEKKALFIEKAYETKQDFFEEMQQGEEEEGCHEIGSFFMEEAV